MSANPALRRLGFADDERVVVLHADDIGMCQATLPAYEEALDFGVLSSAAAMTPCPWFAGLARICRARADDTRDPSEPRLDMGVHLTLNCEWSDYRWGPIATRDYASGLMAADGGMHRLAREVAGDVDLRALEGELRAQVDRALESGIDVTHVDTHMLTLWHPRLLGSYFRIGSEYRLPLFMLRNAAAMFDSAHLEPSAIQDLQAMLVEAENGGTALFDTIQVLPLDSAQDRLGAGKAALEAARPGCLTNILIHPAIDTPEIRAIAPDWVCRVGDYELFTSEAWREAVAASGVRVIGFRALRDQLRQGPAREAVDSQAEVH